MPLFWVGTQGMESRNPFILVPGPRKRCWENANCPIGKICGRNETMRRKWLYPGWPESSIDFSIAESPFQIICVPIHTSKNEDSRMITAIEVAPNT